MPKFALIAGIVIASSVLADVAVAQGADRTPALELGREHGTNASSPFAGLLKALNFASGPGGRIFVVERAGPVKILNRDGSLDEVSFLNVPTADLLELEFDAAEHVLRSIAFHPEFQENGYVFAHYARHPFNGEGLIVRFTVDPESPDAISETRASETAKLVLRIDPYPGRHVGSLRFGSDGWLSLSHPLGRRRLLGPEDLAIE